MAENQRTPIREDYESAAKVARLMLVWRKNHVFKDDRCDEDDFFPMADGGLWSPHHDDDLAFRLLCAIYAKAEKINYQRHPAAYSALADYHAALSSGDPQKARIAIFWLAVEIGRAMHA